MYQKYSNLMYVLENQYFLVMSSRKANQQVKQVKVMH